MSQTGDAADAKARATRAFTEIAATYDQGGPAYFSHFGARLVAFAGLRPGDRVLDVATGRGAILIPAASVVGASGSVTGIDLSAAMLEATGAALKRQGVDNATLCVMDAEELDFTDESFDAVLCGFALMFFPRLERAMLEFRRMLAPSGTLAVSTFASNPGQLLDPVMDAFQGNVRRPLVRDFATEGALRDALNLTGLVDIDVRAETLDIVYPDEQSYWSWQMGLLTGVWLRAQPYDVQQRFEADAMAHLSSISDQDGIHESITALFGRARYE